MITATATLSSSGRHADLLQPCLILTCAGIGTTVITFTLGIRQARFPLASSQTPQKKPPELGSALVSADGGGASSKAESPTRLGEGSPASLESGGAKLTDDSVDVTPKGRHASGSRRLHITRREAIAMASVGAVGAAGFTLEKVLSTSVPTRMPAWRFRANSGVECTPLVDSGSMYFGDQGGEFYAVDLATRTKRWSRQIGPDKSRPAAVGGLVYVGSYDGGVYSLSTANGNPRRTYPTNGGVFGGITVAGDFIYFTCLGGSVHAIHASTGDPFWTNTRLGPGAIKTTPTVVDDVVYVGSSTKYSGYVYALDARNGKTIWGRKVGSPILSGPTVANGVIYVGSVSHKGYVYALDADNGGRELWNHPTGQWIFFSNPAVADGSVYIGSTNGNLYALDASRGTRRWICPLVSELASNPKNPRIQGTPVVSAGVVYIGGLNGKFYAIDAASGEKLWVGITGKEIDASPALADGLVYIGSNDGHVYAFSTAR